MEAETLDAMIGPQGHTTFTAFGDGFRLERGLVKVIVNRGLGDIRWSRLAQIDPASLPEKMTGSLEMFGASYALHGRAFATVKEVALFLLEKLT